MDFCVVFCDSDVGVSVGNYNKRKRSAVWDYFEKSEIEGKSKCLLCKEVVKKLAFRNNGQRQGLQSLVNELTSLPNNVQEESVVTVAPTTATSGSDVLWKEFDSKVADSVNHLNARDGSADAMSETGLYFGEKLIPRDSEPLKWWHEHGKNYPKMSKLARKYLCATATSVPSERLFSKAGELVSHRRRSLKPKNVNMLLFLNQNI